MGNNLRKNISKNLSGKYSQKLLDHVKQSATNAFETTWKKVIRFEKQQKQVVIWLVMKLLIKLRKSQEVPSRIIQNRLQINMIKKYLKKDIYLQKKDRKLLTISD